MNLQTATPVEVDTKIAELYGPLLQAESSQRRALEAAADYRKYGKGYERSAVRQEEIAASLQPTIDRLTLEVVPYNEEFDRRGGWTRFFMVMNAGGHLHSSRYCSTCRWTTQFAWMPEYSGSSESEIVELAGEDACTVCFPSAPVNQQSRLPFRVAERSEREAAAAAKAAKAAAKQAQEVRIAGRVQFKTIRAAENEVGSLIDWAISSRYMDATDADHRVHLDNLTAERIAKAREIAKALTVTVEGYDDEALLTKKFDAKIKQYRKAGWDIPADAKL